MELFFGVYYTFLLMKNLSNANCPFAFVYLSICPRTHKYHIFFHLSFPPFYACTAGPVFFSIKCEQSPRKAKFSKPLSLLGPFLRQMFSYCARRSPHFSNSPVHVSKKLKSTVQCFSSTGQLFRLLTGRSNSRRGSLRRRIRT